MKFLTQVEAAAVDEELFSKGFTLDQLMELAGLAVSMVVSREFPSTTHKKPLLICGPGNNGGDGLVCARHLLQMGYAPRVVCPKAGKAPFIQSLLKQLSVCGIPVLPTLEDEEVSHADVIVDAIFGFSFRPPVKGEFAPIISKMNGSKKPIVCVDLPSGWDVERGDVDGTGIRNPTVNVSLSAPKLCMRNFKGKHYLGGRFIPPEMSQRLGLDLPYPPNSSDQIVLLSDI